MLDENSALYFLIKSKFIVLMAVVLMIAGFAVKTDYGIMVILSAVFSLSCVVIIDLVLPDPWRLYFRGQK